VWKLNGIRENSKILLIVKVRKMKLNLQKLGIIAVILLIFMGCEKNELKEFQENAISKEIMLDNEMAAKSVSLNYIHNGRKIDPVRLDWENDSLNVFFGFDETENAYVFYSEKEMIKWIKNKKRADEVLNVLQNVKTAKEYAAKIGEFENEETSEEFEEFLKKNFGAGEKATGLFYHNVALGGKFFPISSFPKRRLKSSNDNKVSSVRIMGLSMALYSRKNWNGSKKWIWGIPLGYTEITTLGSFNNKMSSYWNF
jgi:hypothetical protein